MKVRGYKREDFDAVREICYQTGYFGESVAASGLFDDKELFCRLFCDYYLIYEPQWAFVAIDDENEDRVVGYMMGTPDSSGQIKTFFRLVVPGLLWHVISQTLWNYPESFLALLSFASHMHNFRPIEGLFTDYPAHFHIDVRKEYQSRHVGTLLYKVFEAALLQRGSPGIHLRTTDRNAKAVIFYERLGYSLLQSEEGVSWPKSGKYHDLLMGKKLTVA